MSEPLEPMIVGPVTLGDDLVTLEPIAPRHAADLADAIDDEAFKYMPMRSSVRTPAEVRRYIDFQRQRSNMRCFAVIDNARGRAVGSTSYLHIRAEHRSLEIGSTWLGPSSRGTLINPSMKLLMLRHALEGLGAIRVEFKTDVRNERSRAAILKLGAVFEGVLRRHIVMGDGHLRDTALYSIIDSDWARARGLLEARLGEKKPSSRGKDEG